jgi:hypothetical protein
MRKFLLAAGLLALLVTARSVHATPLPPGSTGVVPETGSISYTSVVDAKAVAFSFKGGAGTLNEAVVVDATTGHYDFIYQIQVTSGSVTDFKLAGYNNVGGPAAGGNLNVLQTSTPPSPTIPGAGFITGVVPISGVDRTTGSGDNVTTTFSLPVDSNDPSNIIIFQTDVNSFQDNEQAVITFGDGSHNPTDKLVFAPKGGGVPEPTTLLLWSGMATGLGLLGWRKRRPHGRPEPNA